MISLPYIYIFVEIYFFNDETLLFHHAFTFA